MSEPHTHSLPDPLRALAGVPGSALATLTAAFTDEAAIGFDELTALTSSVLTLDQHGAPALTSHGEDAAMLLTLCQQTIAYLTLTQAMTVHALTAATAQARLAADHGPDHAPSATARGRAEGRARTAVLAEAVATCGWDPAHRALVHHLAAMAPDRTQIAARLLAQGVLTGPMVAMLLSRRTEHLTDPQVAWLTRHCANLTHPTTQPDPDSQAGGGGTDVPGTGGLTPVLGHAESSTWCWGSEMIRESWLGRTIPRSSVVRPSTCTSPPRVPRSAASPRTSASCVARCGVGSRSTGPARRPLLTGR
ncbi:hypothetical protein GCM10025862_40070 [Arsenicicoccus piscis]|uniref:DUF222 domain-containing protein n=1 Tax=Arsenicicoccus piscis TaxID=673954 RepID=A0ABQ6HTY3_9MICO|nr:hypothetical protein GCM10025862_40070 [Arsenicicoccus piscis]